MNITAISVDKCIRIDIKAQQKAGEASSIICLQEVCKVSHTAGRESVVLIENDK